LTKKLTLHSLVNDIIKLIKTQDLSLLGSN
jgi:hypothetical protein